MDSKNEFNIFNEFDDLIQKRIDGLTDLRRARQEGKVIKIFSVIDRKEKLKEFNTIELNHDLILLTEEIEYFTGILYFLKPHINNPFNEGKTYFQNRFDKRFLTFANINYQLVYNYWDRIGDLLSYFFETGLPDYKVYFSTVINNIPTEYHISPNYISLKKIYDDELKELFEDRKKAVHYKAISTKIFLDFFQDFDNEDDVRELQIKKESLPDLFKKHLFLTIDGFNLSLNLINELPEKV